jgi:Tfp pilus assembly protein PilN
MPYQPDQGKTAVALFVDGLELKYVQLSAKGTKITLRDFKTVPLAQKFEEKPSAGMGEVAGSPEAAADAFASTAPTTPEGGEGGASNASVLLGIFGELPPAKITVSYALSEPAVTYQEFDSDFGLKGAKLTKKLLGELATLRSTAPLNDSVATIPTAKGGLLTVIREDGLRLIDLLNEIKPFTKGRVPNLSVIESLDFALMEMIRVNYEVQAEEITVIVYVGSEFSRLIFMQGKEYLHFAPVISEGYQSPNLENTIYSRILLEQDNIALTRIDRIILTGECHKLNLRESLAPQFSSALVDYLQTPTLDLSMFEGSVGEAISEYAVPISTAWKVLNPKQEGLYDVNLLPIAIIEGQKAFKLAWHGWLFAGLVFVSIIFFYTSIVSRTAEIRRARDLLARKQTEMQDYVALQEKKKQLQGDIDRFSKAQQLYDQLVPGSDRWSRILHYLGNSIDDLNSLWLYRVARFEKPVGSLMLSGRAVYRTRIPRLASVFEKATLRSVKTTVIRDKIVYEFEILVEKVDKADR